MKSKLSFIIILLFCFAFLFLFSCEKSTTETESYYLQSYNLTETQKEIIEKLLYKKINEITEEDINNIKKITIAGKNVDTADNCISERSSSEYKFYGKTYKYEEAYGNELSALGIFKSLEYLQILYAPSLNDASFLSGLKELRRIDICMTNVRDFTFMEELTKLESVNINTSPVERIKFNQNNNIGEFVITGSLVSDASVFSGLNKNINFVSILFNEVPISNLDILQNFKKLNKLSIVAPKLDLSFLSGVDANIKDLSIGGTDIVNFNEILKLNDTLTDLTILNAEDIDLTPIDELENIENISLYNVKNPVRGTKTQPESKIVKIDVDFNLNFSSWFEYEK